MAEMELKWGDQFTFIFNLFFEEARHVLEYKWLTENISINRVNSEQGNDYMYKLRSSKLP